MSEQELHGVAWLIYFLTFIQFLRGFRSSTSWFCLFFLTAFSQNVFGYAFALLNVPFFSWMEGLPATKLHGQILVVAMISAWASHFLFRYRIATVRLFDALPQVHFAEDVLEKWLRAGAVAGACFQIFLAVTGYLGYFMRRELHIELPYWLDSAYKLIALLSGFLFLLVVNDFQKFGKITNWTKFLLVLWMVSGLFTGFKSTVVRPAFFVMIGAWMSRFLDLRHFALLAFAIVLAYSIVEPLREAKIENKILTSQVAMTEVLGSEGFAMMKVSDVLERFSRRIDITTMGVETLAAFEQGGLPNYKQRLDEYFRLFPVLAFIPRALWSTKPGFNIGAVLYKELRGGEMKTSVTPSVIVTSFIWGGWPGLIIIYVLWGLTCTIGGQIVVNTRQQLLAYAPFFLFAAVLSAANDVMAVSYISILRMLALLLVLYCVGTLRRPDCYEGRPLRAGQ